MASLSTSGQGELIVAIPARNEAAHIDACLDALAAQRGRTGVQPFKRPLTVILLVNNSHDATASLARARAGSLPFRLLVRERDLPRADAHAGGARRAVMDDAARLAKGRDAIICSTDADSEVSPTWLGDVDAALRNGADAVAGVVAFKPPALGEAPFPPTRRLEDRYAALQAEVIARTDPEAHNPWPNHIWAWGANFALRRSAYIAVGGVPNQPLAEDRALAEALRAHDFKVRHSLDVRVRTSRRDQGRAPGGLADLVRNYMNDDAHPCDAALEPILSVLARAGSRRQARKAWSSPKPAARLARTLRLDLDFVDATLSQPCFGKAWLTLEKASPLLVRVRLLPEHLPLEIARAQHLLAGLRPSGAGGPGDTSPASSAGLWSAEARPA